MHGPSSQKVIALAEGAGLAILKEGSLNFNKLNQKRDGGGRGCGGNEVGRVRNQRCYYHILLGS